MYLFITKKKPQEHSLLWNNIKEIKNDRFIDSLDEYISLSGKKNHDERVSVSCLIYSALGYLKEKGIIKNVGVLKKSQFGKPYIEGVEVNINLSHSDSFAVLLVDTECNVGVDVQEEIPRERVANLEKRFSLGLRLGDEKTLNSRHVSPLKEENVLSLLETKGVFIYLFDLGVIRKINSSLCERATETGKMSNREILQSEGAFEEKWTIAEAVMKCDGRGFSALPELSELSKNMEIFSFIYKDEEKKAYISLAKKTENSGC